MDEIQDYEDLYDIIFIDIPRLTHGAEDKMNIAILSLCDSVLIPIKTGELDSLSTLAFVKMIKDIAAHKKARKRPYQYAAFLSMSGRRPTDDSDAREFIDSLEVPLLKNELRDVRELKRPYTYESLLDIGKSERERFKPFFEEVINFFKL